MSTLNEIKLKQLLDEHVPGSILLSSWLKSKGISYELQKRYKKSGWLESVGSGAYKRPKEIVSWEGGLFSLQKQVDLQIFPGGLTALSFLGFSQYTRITGERVFLYSPLSVRLPSWYKKYPWGNPITFTRTSMLPNNMGYTEYELPSFFLRISSAERAMLEYLFLTPDKADLMEGYQIITGLTNLRPKILQGLLSNCTSIKVKRLFLYMAKKAGHQWLSFIDLNKIDLGSGDRSIVKNGSYVADYGITIPKELAGL